MANILNPNEDYNPKNGLKVIYTKLIEIINRINSNTSDITTLQGLVGTPPTRYVALMTQTSISTTSGVLVVGKTYNIAALQPGDNFANVGYLADGDDFVATGTTPTTWTNSTSVLNVTDSAPSSEVLQNGFNDRIEWSYDVAGDYIGTLSGAFTANKTAIIISQPADSTDYLARAYWIDVNTIGISTSDTGVPSDGILSLDTITIEVYA